jgi:DNA-binding response OmpR family regulator
MECNLTGVISRIVKTVLLLERSKEVRAHLEAVLRAEGLMVVSVSSARELQTSLIKRQGLDLFLLYHRELLLETELWDFIKDHWPNCPVFVLLEDNSAAERAKILRQGVDDCLSPPINEAELCARIQNLIGRAERRNQAAGLLGNTTVQQQFRMIVIDGKSHQIPAKEFFLLKCLSQTPGRVFDRNELLDHVWGSSTDADTNVLEVTVSNLRKRLTKLGSSLKIRNSRNLGYWIEG